MRPASKRERLRTASRAERLESVGPGFPIFCATGRERRQRASSNKCNNLHASCSRQQVAKWLLRLPFFGHGIASQQPEDEPEETAGRPLGGCPIRRAQSPRCCLAALCAR